MNQNMVYPPNINTRPPFQNAFNAAPRCLQNAWRRPTYHYVRRNLMPGRYINIGVRPISHPPNAPVQYKYIQSNNYAASKPPVMMNTPIGQKPQLFQVPANAVGNQINQLIIPVSQYTDKQIAVKNSAQYGNNPILSNSMTNLQTGITPRVIQRPSFYPLPCNKFQSQNNQIVIPLVNNNGCQSTTASTNQINGSNISNASSGLTFQSPAAGVGINFYNNNIIESAWNKNVFESNEVKQTPIVPEIEQHNQINADYPNQSMQNQTFNGTYVNALYSQNLSMTSKLIMPPMNNCIAPSQNICSIASLNISNVPSQNYFLPCAAITQHNTANCDIRHIMPPAIFQNPVVSHNLSSNIIINECNHNVTQNVLSSKNVIENNSNVNYNLLPLTDTDDVVGRHKNAVSSNNLIYSNQNSTQDCLGTKTNDNNKPGTQNQFSINEMIHSGKNNSSAKIGKRLELTTNMVSIKDI